MLHESGLLTDFELLQWGATLFVRWPCLFLGSISPRDHSDRGNNLTPQMELYNQSISEVRVAVESLFRNTTNYFKFIGFKRQMKVNLSPVGKLYFVCALLENAQTCLYRNQVSQMFAIEPPTLGDYFSR